MERKALKWGNPRLIYLSTCESHGAAACSDGIDVDSPGCKTGIGATGDCSFGDLVGPSGTICKSGISASNPQPT